jgi:L-fuculose-phosphate aldolase
MSPDLLKNEIALFMQRLYRQGLTTTSGGNISALTDDGLMLITPSASDKGRMCGDEIGCMDMDGKIVGKDFKPSIEGRMHLEIYKTRKDIKAIVHAHPITASAFASGTAEINTRFLAESYAILGNIGYAPYCTMGTLELAQAVAETAKTADCIIMRNHGALTVGSNLLQAFDRLEVLEAAAKITLLNRGILADASVELTAMKLAEIDVLMNRP